MQHRYPVATSVLAFVMLAILTAPGGTVQAGEAIATAETNWQGVEVHVMNLDRRGAVLTAKFVAVNTSDESRSIAFGFIGNDVCYAVDEESGSKYYVLTDTEGNPVASAKEWMPNSTHGINRKLDPGASVRVWMKLPAPPPEVTSVSLFLNETDPIEDVPITDK